MKWTTEQERVITLKNKNLLVSAAAGSGKTAVLTERIAGKICDDKKQIDRMLIVTFTIAAAGEMRERIGKRLREKLAENPNDSHIRKQLALLHTAQITTIDSFCLYILKNHFEEIGVDPSFAVGTQGELSDLSSEAFDEIIEESFEKGEKEFLNLVEMYAPKGKFRDLKDLVLNLARKVDATPYPYDTLRGLLVDENTNIWDLEFVNFIKEYEDRYLNEALKTYELIRDLTEDTELAKHNDEAKAEISFLNGVLSGDMSFRMRAFQTHEFIGLQYGRKKFTPEDELKKEAAGKLNKYASDIIKKIADTFHYVDEEHFAELAKDGFIVTNSLIKLTLSYMDRFEEKKRDRGIISFSDMEHMALDILVKKEADGTLSPTKTALVYRDYFDEVMIDEYQDSNDVQETILGIISKEDDKIGNRFMVGDIKQSIYGFRLAKPDIFRKKCEEYHKDEEERDVKIILSHNFRSRNEVIDAVNYIFERSMKKDVGGVEYDEDERLNFGFEDYPESSADNKAELLFFREDGYKAVEELKNLSAAEVEAKMVAVRIKDLIESETEVYDKKENKMRKAKFSDIAILLRSVSSGKDAAFRKALKDEGIPSYVITKTGYYSTWEVELMIDFLTVIDNPRQDFPLLGVMHSFIGGFSEKEIAKIRAKKSRKRLIDSVKEYAENGSEETIKEKAREFLSVLESLRKMSLYMSASDMLREIYSRYEYTVMVSSLPGGEQRLANVKLLVDTADEYESQGIFCIHDFVKYIEKLKSQNVDMGEANLLDENANVVRIMTIHKSKGLEFPICFVSSLHTEFRLNSDKVLIDETFGIAGDAFDLQKRIKNVSPIKRAIKVKCDIKDIGEEIRILYVALTRAREKLIMTGMIKDEYPAKDNLSYIELTSLKSFMEIVFPLAGSNPDLFDMKEFNCQFLEGRSAANETERYSEKTLLDSIPEGEDFVEYEYDKKLPDGLYVKTTVSELKKAAYMEREDGENTLYKTKEKKVPKFIGKEDDEIGGSDRGSAYHRVMELMNFDSVYDGDLAENIRSHRRECIEKLFISEEEDALVSENKVKAFLETDLAKRMSEASKQDKLYLEQPFVLSVNAHEVNPEFPSEESVLVQGVIDVYFEENGKLVLMDYKTDRVDTSDELINRYKTQLDYYAEALSRLEKKEVSEIYIYSFALGSVIKV